MEDKIESLSQYIEGRLEPLVHISTEPPVHHREHRLSDAFVTLKDSIIGDTLHKTGEAFNDPDEDEKMMDDKRKMSESKEW
uniref:Uncharacterized protein n=1 Tax=Caenorhabditis tropicalis TaxID=1561998 RepID=A0A1I7UWH8_9PELO